MRDVEIKLNSFKLKKLVALSMCAVMAMGVMTMPVNAAEDQVIRPTGTDGSQVSYTGDANNTAPENVLNLLRKNVTLANGDTLGLYYQVGNIVRNVRGITPEKWVQVEAAMNKAFKAIEEKQFEFTWFDGKNIEDHKAYTSLMNDIVSIIGGSITYDGVNTVFTEYNGDKSSQTFTKFEDKPAYIATGDAKDPSKVIDFIKNSESNEISIAVNDEVKTMPKSVFQAAKESGKKLSFSTKDDKGNNISFNFKDGIKNDVDMNLNIKTSMDNDLVKNLKDEGALVFEFAHEGVLPGPMEVRFYNEAYKDQKEATAFLYLLNEKTSKLEKQEQSVSIERGWVTFTIDHCSSYVTTLTEIVDTKLQVAEAKPDAKEPTTGTTDKKDNAIKATGSETVAFQTIALLTLCGAAVVIASKKEKKLN